MIGTVPFQRLVTRVATIVVVVSISGCAAPSRTSTPTSLPTPATTPAPTATTNPTALPTPTALASPDTEAEWIEFKLTEGTPGYGVLWSPDSRHLLVRSSVPAAGVLVKGLELVHADGRSIRWYPGLGWPAWLDDEHFIAYSSRHPTTADFNPDAAWLMDTVGSDPVPSDIPIPSGSHPLGNGYGAVAIDHFLGEAPENVERHEFVVWSNGAVTQTHDGFAYLWSLDGTKLAVLHPFAPTRGVEGWLEVVSWPDLATIYEQDPHEQIGDAHFDPAGQHIAFHHYDMVDGKDLNHVIRVVSLDSGEYIEVTASNRTQWFWASGFLNTIDLDGKLRQYDTGGNLIASRRAPSGDALPSDDGSTVLYGAWDGASTLTIDRHGSLTQAELPTMDYYHPGMLASDGSHVALAADRIVWLRDL